MEFFKLFLESTANQRVTALNGQAFRIVPSLEVINLQNNFCINRIFFGKEEKSTAIENISNRCGFEEFDSIEVVCESFKDFRREFCDMRQKTIINASNFVIGDLQDEEVEGIFFEGNMNIEYLPYKIYMQFPNLQSYWAKQCAIKQISKENFEKLIRLKEIDLEFNQIQKISGNTFQGLESLTIVDLGEFLI